MIRIERDGWSFEADPDAQARYYETQEQCECDYCKNYREQIETAYPEVCTLLKEFGLEPRRLDECSSWVTDDGTIEYQFVEYVVCGTITQKVPYEIDIGPVSVAIQTDGYHKYNVEDSFFVLQLFNIVLDDKYALCEEAKTIETTKKSKRNVRKYIVLGLVGIILAIWLIATAAHIGRPVSAIATFDYNDQRIEQPMEQNDMLMVWRAVNGHHMSTRTIPSCGFDKDCSVTLVDKQGRETTVCFACDNCANYYILEKDAYTTSTRFRGDKVKEMLRGYGFVFPCY